MAKQRTVSITIGVPDHLRDVIDAQAGEPMEDCYCIHFAEVGDGVGFTVQGACLCTLVPATEAWLGGATIKETQALMAREHDEEESGE